ncbi:TIGR02270 family protein [Hyalangium versicolor]|uniref:TIGR02270 family protein n=1 Tax=Hyalangium versicolor TaxID=2861190 RepID=UPI001CCB585D|nr:TIGR02270 family protein [Hyalangium versicolor]
MPPLKMDVLEEHFAEAAFLWSQWERALQSPAYDVLETAALEERLLAHLDGLVLGGEVVAGELLLPALEADDAGKISAAAFALLSGNGKRELEETLAVFDGGDALQQNSVGRALGLSEREGLEAALRKRLKADDVALRVAAFQVLSFRGAISAEFRGEWLYRDDAGQVIAALQDANPLSQDIVQSLLPRLLVDPRPGVREAAIMAGLVSGASPAWKACRQVAKEGGEGRRQCLVTLALGRDEKDAEWLASLVNNEEQRADVLWALGFSGQTVAAEACLQVMHDERVANLAGEAFSAITGLKLEGKYQLPPPEEEESLVPLDDEDLDKDLVPGPEASLPLPAADAVEGWWKQARKSFERGTRYLRGQKADEVELLDALRSEPMRRRPVHALDLSIRSRGAQNLQPQAFTLRQLAEWEKARAGSTRVSKHPFAKIFLGWGKAVTSRRKRLV